MIISKKKLALMFFMLCTLNQFVYANSKNNNDIPMLPDFQTSKTKKPIDTKKINTNNKENQTKQAEPIKTQDSTINAIKSLIAEDNKEEEHNINNNNQSIPQSTNTQPQNNKLNTSTQQNNTVAPNVNLPNMNVPPYQGNIGNNQNNNYGQQEQSGGNNTQIQQPTQQNNTVAPNVNLPNMNVPPYQGNIGNNQNNNYGQQEQSGGSNTQIQQPTQQNNTVAPNVNLPNMNVPPYQGNIGNKTNEQSNNINNNAPKLLTNNITYNNNNYNTKYTSQTTASKQSVTIPNNTQNQQKQKITMQDIINETIKQDKISNHTEDINPRMPLSLQEYFIRYKNQEPQELINIQKNYKNLSRYYKKLARIRSKHIKINMSDFRTRIAMLKKMILSKQNLQKINSLPDQIKEIATNHINTFNALNNKTKNITLMFASSGNQEIILQSTEASNYIIKSKIQSSMFN